MSDITRTRPNADQMDSLIASAQDIANAIRSGGFDDSMIAALLNQKNYKAIMRLWFERHGSAVLTDYTKLCNQWYEITRTGWNGGVRFAIPGSGQAANSDGTKTGDNLGMSCTPSTTVTANQDDYADVPLFFPIDVNVVLDSHGDPHITAIDGICGTFKRSDPSAIVGVMQMTGWKRAVIDADAGIYGWDYTDTPELTGFQPLPEAVSLRDNSVRNFVVHGKYGFGEGWTCCSGQKQKIFNVSYESQRTGVRSAWSDRYCGATSADDAFMKLMLYLKYGRLDTDRILHGCCNYNYDYTPAVAETGVERVLITTAQAANLIVGSTVHLSTSARGGTAVADRVKITKIETVNVDGTDYGAVYVDNGGTTFDTTTSLHLCTIAWHTGSTDGVLGNDGGIDPTNDRFPVKIQGIEYMVGCYEAMGDTMFVYGDNGGVNCMTPWICRDASKLASSKTADYAAAHGIPTPGSSTWQYPKQMREGSTLPELIFPIDNGGSSSAGPRDGMYTLNNTSGSYEWLRFGNLDGGVEVAGLACGIGNFGLSGAYWYIGGRLSVTGNRGEFQAAA